jgi:hypothetical protein
VRVEPLEQSTVAPAGISASVLSITVAIAARSRPTSAAAIAANGS